MIRPDLQGGRFSRLDGYTRRERQEGSPLAQPGVSHDAPTHVPKRKSPNAHFGSFRRGVPSDLESYVPDIRGMSSPNASGVNHDEQAPAKDKRSPTAHFGSSSRGVAGDLHDYIPDVRGISSPNAIGVSHDEMKIKDKRSPAAHLGTSARGVAADLNVSRQLHAVVRLL